MSFFFCFLFCRLEINRVRNDIFCPSSFLMSLPKPKPQEHVVKLTEKVYAKVKEYPKVWFFKEDFSLSSVAPELFCA